MSGAGTSGAQAGGAGQDAASSACSVQQIKFDCISYIKEFGADAGQWVGGSCAMPRETLFRSHGVDPACDLWLWKPALSTGAARTVARFLQGRLGVGQGKEAEVTEGRFVFLYRKRRAQA